MVSGRGRVVAVVVAGALGVPPLVTAGSPVASDAGVEEIASVLAASQGVPREQARRLLLRQDTLVRTAAAVTSRLGGGNGGAWIDPTSARLVVNVVGAVPPEVHRSGATARPVTHSLAALEELARRVEAAAERHQPEQADFYVDVPANAVTVEVFTGTWSTPATTAFRHAVGALGPAVRLRRGTTEAQPAFAPAPFHPAPLRSAPGQPGRHQGPDPALNDPVPAGGTGPAQPDRETIVNGDRITAAGRACSAGFWVRDAATRTDLLLTAGHCLRREEDLWAHGGAPVGHQAQATYGWWGDWGTIHIGPRSNRPTTRISLSDTGADASVSGHSRVPIGTVVCKFGATSGRTCGPVKAYGVTAVYRRKRVHGMAKAQLCVAPGDSGGPVFARAADGTLLAQGLISGGDGRRACRDHEPAFFMPIDTALRAGGLKLVVQR